MDAKSDRKTKKSTLLSWKCGDWIEIVESERKSGIIFVSSIRCKICRKHKKKLMTLRNFNAAWCCDRGTTNVKKDGVLTLMKGEPHKLAMKLVHESEFMKQPGPLPSCAATPLGKAVSVVGPRRCFDTLFSITSMVMSELLYLMLYFIFLLSNLTSVKMASWTNVLSMKA